MLPRDTAPEAQAVQDAAYRRMSPGEKLQAALDLSAVMMKFTRCGIRLRNPSLDEDGVARALIEQLHGVDVSTRDLSTSPKKP